MRKFLLTGVAILALAFSQSASSAQPVYPVAPNTPQANRLMFTNCSGTITTGATAQQLLPQNNSRFYLYISNLSNANLYLGIDSTVNGNAGMILSPGVGYIFSVGTQVPLNAIWLYGATTGQQFGCFWG